MAPTRSASPKERRASGAKNESHFERLSKVTRAAKVTKAKKAKEPKRARSGARWNKQEEAYLVEQRKLGTKYEHIGPVLKRSNLSCRLHVHSMLVKNRLLAFELPEDQAEMDKEKIAAAKPSSALRLPPADQHQLQQVQKLPLYTPPAPLTAAYQCRVLPPLAPRQQEMPAPQTTTRREMMRPLAPMQSTTIQQRSVTLPPIDSIMRDAVDGLLMLKEQQ